jgi:hypothetical protein
MGKKSGYGTGIRNPERTTRIIFPRAYKPFFLVKILNFLMRIRDPDPGSGFMMEKIWIRDGVKFGSGMGKVGYGIRNPEKHPGSATLQIC